MNISAINHIEYLTDKLQKTKDSYEEAKKQNDIHTSQALFGQILLLIEIKAEFVLQNGGERKIFNDFKIWRTWKKFFKRR
jgi:hypothetical protein